MNARLSFVTVLASLFTVSTLLAQEAPQQQPRPARAPSGGQPAVRSMTGPAGPLVTLEVLLIEHQVVAGEDEEPAGIPSAAEFVRLFKQGKLDNAVRVQLSTVGGSTGTVQLGERVPVATARNARGFGGRGGANGDGAFSYSYSIQDIGTMVMATARVEESGTALVDLHVERSRLAPSDRPADEPQDEIARRKTVSLTSQSTLRLKSGQSGFARAWQTTTGRETNGLFVVVTAEVEPGGPARAAAAERDAAAQLQVFVLGNAKADDMHRILQQVFGDRAIRISVDEANNRIIVYAPPAQLETIRELIQVLDAVKK